MRRLMADSFPFGFAQGFGSPLRPKRSPLMSCAAAEPALVRVVAAPIALANALTVQDDRLNHHPTSPTHDASSLRSRGASRFARLPATVAQYPNAVQGYKPGLTAESVSATDTRRTLSAQHSIDLRTPE